MTAPLLMALVAALCAIGAVLLIRRPAPSEAAIYRHRIAATMLGAAAIILAGYAWTLQSWNAAS